MEGADMFVIINKGKPKFIMLLYFNYSNNVQSWAFVGYHYYFSIHIFHWKTNKSGDAAGHITKQKKNLVDNLLRKNKGETMN